MKNKKPQSYEEAMSRLEEIVRGLESGTLPLNSLSEKLGQAQELLLFCQEQLSKTEADINKTINNEQK